MYLPKRIPFIPKSLGSPCCWGLRHSQPMSLPSFTRFSATRRTVASLSAQSRPVLPGSRNRSCLSSSGSLLFTRHVALENNRCLLPLASGITPARVYPARHYTPPKQQFYQNRILDPYVQQAVNPITLRQLVVFGRNMQPDKLLKSANYVRKELPIRLAHRIRDFQNLPFIVGTNPHIERVYELYWQGFDRIRQVPEIKSLDDNDRFCELVKGLLNDHLVVIPQLALGIMESSKHLTSEQVDKFMNTMLRSRISRRVLAEQHISLTANFNSPNYMMTDRGYIGIIYTHCNPREIVERTAVLAAETCRRQLHCVQRSEWAKSGPLEPPKVILDGDIDTEFAYIPDHIEYILYELLKNSMRFVMLRGKINPKTGELPPIQITVCEGTNDIVFRISDQGGGIHPDMEANLWSYSQSATRFANFEKISKMAATVQEQMVSPSRGVNAAGLTTSQQQQQRKKEQKERGIREDAVTPTAAWDRHQTEMEVMKYHQEQLKQKTAYEDGSVQDNEGLENAGGRRSRSRRPSDEEVVLPPPPEGHKDSNPGLSPTSNLFTRPTSAVFTEPTKTTAKSKGRKESSKSSTSAATAPDDPLCDPTSIHEVLEQQQHEQQEDLAMHLGIGLPMSRVYAEYWGGDLKVYTMHGYGTDAYARFCKFGNIYENFDV